MSDNGSKKKELALDFYATAGAGQEYWDRLFREVGAHVNEMILVVDHIAWLTLVLFGKFAWKKIVD